MSNVNLNETAPTQFQDIGGVSLAYRHFGMVPTVNSYILQQHLPDARLILYPDSGARLALPVF
jgi:hypothetical protein